MDYHNAPQQKEKNIEHVQQLTGTTVKIAILSLMSIISAFILGLFHSEQFISIMDTGILSDARQHYPWMSALLICVVMINSFWGISISAHMAVVLRCGKHTRGTLLRNWIQSGCDTDNEPYFTLWSRIEYVVDGARYENSAEHDLFFRDRKAADIRMAELNAIKHISVYYDERNPNRMRLHRKKGFIVGEGLSAAGFIIASLCFSLIAGIILG